jgi:hypothetical protein
MRALYVARRSDFGPSDLVQVECECGCGHSELPTARMLTTAGAALELKGA